MNIILNNASLQFVPTVDLEWTRGLISSDGTIIPPGQSGYNASNIYSKIIDNAQINGGSITVVNNSPTRMYVTVVEYNGTTFAKRQSWVNTARGATTTFAVASNNARILFGTVEPSEYTFEEMKSFVTITLA